VPHWPFDSRRIGLSANRVQFVGKPEAIRAVFWRSHYYRVARDPARIAFPILF
jgi:hypothetical protein